MTRSGGGGGHSKVHPGPLSGSPSSFGRSRPPSQVASLTTIRQLPIETLEHIARQAPNPLRTAFNFALAMSDKEFNTRTVRSKHASIKRYAAKLNEKFLGGVPRSMSVTMRKTDISVSSDELRKLLNRPRDFLSETLSGHPPEVLRSSVTIHGNMRVLKVPDTPYFVENYDKNPVKFDNYKFSRHPGKTTVMYAHSRDEYYTNDLYVYDSLQLMFPILGPDNLHPMYALQSIDSVTLDTEYEIDGSEPEEKWGYIYDSESDYDSDVIENHPGNIYHPPPESYKKREKMIGDIYRLPSPGSIEGGGARRVHKEPARGRRRKAVPR